MHRSVGHSKKRDQKRNQMRHQNQKFRSFKFEQECEVVGHCIEGPVPEECLRGARGMSEGFEIFSKYFRFFRKFLQRNFMKKFLFTKLLKIF